MVDIKENEYEKRIVAYGDIIGWKEAIKEKPFEFLINIINQIDKYKNGFSPDNKENLAQYNKKYNSSNKIQEICKEHAGIEFSFFSDNFAISAPITNTPSHVFGILAVITDKLLHHKPQPFLVRGGVAFGDLFHRADAIFGPALVEAVKIEKMALYPRFLCSDGLIEYLNNTTYKNNVLFQDDFQELMINTACGSKYNLYNLNKIIGNEIQKLKTEGNPLKYLYKWQYMKVMLPKMFEKKHKEEITMINMKENICDSISSSFEIGDLVYSRDISTKRPENEMRIIEMKQSTVAECAYVKSTNNGVTVICEEKREWFPISELIKSSELKLCKHCLQVMNHKDATKCTGCNASLS